MQTLYMNLIDPVAQVTLFPLIYPHTTVQRQQAWHSSFPAYCKLQEKKVTTTRVVTNVKKNPQQYKNQQINVLFKKFRITFL